MHRAIALILKLELLETLVNWRSLVASKTEKRCVSVRRMWMIERELHAEAIH